MILSVILLVASCTSSDAKVASVLERWCRAVNDAESGAPGPRATLREKMLHLIRMDEITRQNLWLTEDPSLDLEQRRVVEDMIGQDLVRIDRKNTVGLKSLLPKSGWFSNNVHGWQIAHGAWLIAQHSPEDDFREYALTKMAVLVRSGGVDAKDYALTVDRVRVHKGMPQIYGSQVKCSQGHMVLFPLMDEEAANRERELIGWAQTLEETKGDLEVGKPCAL